MSHSLVCVGDLVTAVAVKMFFQNCKFLKTKPALNFFSTDAKKMIIYGEVLGNWFKHSVKQRDC